MAADYNKPVTTDDYADILTQLRDNIAAAQNMLNDLTGVTNIPTGALRYDQTSKKFQTYNGTTFVDTVLSKEAGGTGITNWVKATTGEAEAGTPDKYPDAEKVKESIAHELASKTLIATPNATSYDLDSYAGGHPGAGFYQIYYQPQSGGTSRTGVIYASPNAYASSAFIASMTIGGLFFETCFITSGNVISVESSVFDPTVSPLFDGISDYESRKITAIYKINQS